MSVQEKQKVIESNAASVSEWTSGFLALLVSNWVGLGESFSTIGAKNKRHRLANEISQRR